MAYSQEAANDIGAIYSQVLGRPVDSASLAYWQNGLAGTQTLANVRPLVAQSSEAAGDIGTIYSQVLGRPVDSGSLTYWENGLAGTQTLAGVRLAVAQSPEAAGDIGAIYSQVLGRPVDSASLTYWENGLAGTQTLANVQSLVAHSGEAAGDINTIFQLVLGRGVSSGDSAYVTTLENAMATGTSLSAIPGSVAQSSEAQNQITLAFADWGQSAPTASAASQAEAALGNLAEAFILVGNDTLAQLTSLASGYTASGTALTVGTIISTVATSQAEANALVASALTNSYIDVAPDEASVQTTLALGGENLLDAGFDQGTGLDAVIVQQTLNTTGCTNTAAFIAQHVTSVANTTIGAANSPPYQNGIQWYSLNPGVPLYNRIQEQGYPYENYVTTVLGANYKQTVPNFAVFDHWNVTSFSAVSDKTLDTNATTYGNPAKITTQMIKYGIKMNNFFADGSVTAPVSFTQAIIESYGFQFAVPSTTNSAQWQAICAGYQDMMAKSSKPLSITINQVF